MSHLFDFQQPKPSARRRKLPRLSVIGAGIGDPELITLKGLRALMCADVVLYDALVSEALLDFAPPRAERIFVGKRRQFKAFSQDAINEAIVQHARRKGHVVRLKGGDPFVFGRGLEEMQYALDHGLSVEYIPGVSSAIAAPGVAGLAVTLRGHSRSFWVLTATTDTGAFNPEIEAAAHTDATAVILMGVSKIADIAEAYRRAGKPDLPVAVIENATLPQQQVIFGTISDVEEKVRACGAGSPAVIVAGAVVGQRLPLTVSTAFEALIPVS